MAYEKNNLIYRFDQVSKPIYICYNEQLLYLPVNSETRLLSNNDTCRPYNMILGPDIFEPESIDQYIHVLNNWLQMWTSWIYNDSIVCNKSTMYQCIYSYKCITKRRLFDVFQDCFHNDDENIFMWNKNCSITQGSKYFKCETVNECIPLHFIKDGTCTCTTYDGGICDDERPEYYDSKTKIIFQRICDNITHLYPIMIDDQNQTDETECDQWPCNNIYTHCDGF